MKRVKHGNQIPRGADTNIDRPELGIVGQGSTFNLLYDRVVQYRKGKWPPCWVGGCEANSNNSRCAADPESCEDDDPNQPPSPVG